MALAHIAGTGENIFLRIHCLEQSLGELAMETDKPLERVVPVIDESGGVVEQQQAHCHGKPAEALHHRRRLSVANANDAVNG